MKKIRNIVGILSKEDGKSKNLFKNIGLSLVVKGLAILVSLVNIPIFMNYFSDSVTLGLWFSLLSMMNWILTFDFGIGNGLRNNLVIALEEGDKEECNKLISSSYFSMALIAIVFSFITFFVAPMIDWNAMSNVPITIVPAHIMVQTVRFLLIGIWIQFLLAIVNSILYALQKPAIPNLLLLISNISLLLCTFLLKTNNSADNLLSLAAIYVFTSNIPMMVATGIVFFTKLKGGRIKLSNWTKIHTKKIIVLGSNFLVLQLLSMVVFNTREFFIMRFVDPSSVVPYQVYHKLFSLVSTFFILATTPLWSAITQASAQEDIGWIKRTYRRGKLLFGIFALGSILVVVFAQFFVNIWLDDNAIRVDPLYSVLFSLFNIEYMWISLHSNFENGMGKLRIQRMGYLIAAFLFPTLVSVFTSYNNQWIFVLIANIVALIPISILQPIYFRNTMCEAEKAISKSNNDIINN